MTSPDDLPPDVTRIGVIATAAHVDAAYARALAAVLAEGHAVPGAQPSREILNHVLEIEDPRDRLLLNPRQPIKLVTAVARFAWMVAANDRLADIRFYEPMVSGYSDDGLTVPGSDYGRRLFQPRPGLNQIAGAIGRLRPGGPDGRPDGGVRRAAAVVWEPEDAVRDSSDLPCAFGLFFHLRGGELVTTLIMRSNNAVTLLPWNIFEFSLVAELVAAGAGVELGPLVYHGVSMHVYDNAVERAEQALAGYEEIAGQPRKPMAPMPQDPDPMEQARELGRLEATLRHELAQLRDETLDELLARGATLAPWWLELYRILLVHALVRVGRLNVAQQVVDRLASEYRRDMQAHMAHAYAQAGTAPPAPRLELAGAPAPGDEDAFEAVCEQLEAEDDRPLTRLEYRELRSVHVDAVAARGRETTVEQFRATLRAFRSRPPA